MYLNYSSPLTSLTLRLRPLYLDPGSAYLLHSSPLLAEEVSGSGMDGCGGDMMGGVMSGELSRPSPANNITEDRTIHETFPM
jgi:hypothetical protein